MLKDIAQVSHHLTSFYGPATGLLFGFTYLYAAINHTFGLDWRPYSWYSLFVAINTIPAAILSHYSDMLDDHKVLGITEARLVGDHLVGLGCFVAYRFH